MENGDGTKKKRALESVGNNQRPWGVPSWTMLQAKIWSCILWDPAWELNPAERIVELHSSWRAAASGKCKHGKSGEERCILKLHSRPNILSLAVLTNSYIPCGSEFDNQIILSHWDSISVDTEYDIAIWPHGGQRVGGKRDLSDVVELAPREPGGATRTTETSVA